MLTHGYITDSVWTENEVSGTAMNAIAMVAEESSPTLAEGNRFADNVLSLELLDEAAQECLPLPRSHLYFDVSAHNNTAVGFEGLVVVDNGEGNTVD